MIESIRIESVPYFSESPEELGGLSKINFFYGLNGSGKTTISRLIAAADRFPSCAVKWKNDGPLQTFVYNSDFVKENFSREEIKGIFTLGKDDIGIKEKIENIRKEIAVLGKTVSDLKISREGENGDGGKERELEELESEFEKMCWKQKTKHDEYFRHAFKGYMGALSKFKEKVLEESMSAAAGLKPLDYLKQKAEDIFKDDLSELEEIPAVRKEDILSHEANPILGKKIVGRGDIDIADMIRRLGNSDWVKSGRIYFEKNDEEACPFCQQKTPEEFAKSLNEYFDETFKEDMAEVGGLADSYGTDSGKLQEQVRSIMESASEFLEVKQMGDKKRVLDRIIATNAERIKTKKAEPSRKITLETAADVIAGMEDLIEEANAAIGEHNESVRNLGREREKLTGQAWRYIVEELKDSISGYRRRRDKLTGDIEGIDKEVRSKLHERKEKNRQVEKLERERTGVQRTVEEINSILSSVGFTSFRLAKTEAGDFYRVVREGGENAKETLSEGEERFVTFLYFYHLLKGSQSGGGTASDCVAVFDDPVSSLDGEMLFVISNLIKGVFEEIKTGEGNIKQAFVLTHNVYFHKEITYGRPKKKEAKPTFWIVRKSQGKKLKKSESNPIKTSYELLWVDVRNDERHCSGTLQNTMRRILEYYFKILGGVNKDDICGEFDGKRKTICNSLFSWAHAGSHHVDEGLYVSMSHSDELYREVFREIFEKSGHAAHYDMMMGKSSA